jgi:hypothetical protein
MKHPIEIELAWQVRPFPKLFPNLGYEGEPFLGYREIYYDGKHRMFGFWWLSIHWYI